MPPHPSDAPATAPASPPRWWREAVVYQVYPRSFADGNGDGTGDLPGIRSRLPYLKELGVDALWLNPSYASPQADAGHDVADHRAVDPVLGTLADAEELIRDAHGLGMRVIRGPRPQPRSGKTDGFRDGCRVPLPWTVAGASYGFGTGGSRLPQPEGWGTLSVEAQTGDPDPTLELYRAALALRRRHPGLGAGDTVGWDDAPDGVLALRRPGCVCTANTTVRALSIPRPGSHLLSSSPVEAETDPPGPTFTLPAHTTAWWTP
ncbi:alpha-amylase family glycosyl hydrolase [Streptomyces sp. NPDC004111]|uniref:alpha-amylase family glycosyl hydrolase n=1 Tax=Streptomyces sp. NPDC004111 TaxID=3364690 RepID=UPI00367C0D97